MNTTLTAEPEIFRPESEELSYYCCPGTAILDDILSISESVELRIITFTPSENPDKPPVLFIPGWVTRLDSWTYSLRELTKNHKVYYVETREKRTSRIADGTDLTVESIAGDIVFLAEKFDLPDNNYILFGSSLGATAIFESFRYLTRRPLMLALVGPNAEFRIPKWGIPIIYIFPPSLYLLLKPFIKWYLKNFRLDTESDMQQYVKYCSALEDADPYKLKKAAKNFWRYKVWSILPDIDVPTLIIGADKDQLHEPGNIEKMLPLLPRGHFIDMHTNTGTQSKKMVEEMEIFILEHCTA